MSDSGGVARRDVLKAGGALLLQAVVPLSACGRSDPATPAGAVPRYLSDAQLRTLRAFTDRMIPADTDPGAVAASCAEAIDRLLGAFSVDPPYIHAGAPFSDRNGHPRNDFLDFVPLDDYEALGWRIAIEGSLGRPEREFNGPVRGLQAIYGEGLARLDELAVQAGFADFASAPAGAQDSILGNADPLVAELVDVGFGDTLDAMYGAPEYGGNQGLAGWGFTAYDGDVQPRGYGAEQVVNSDDPVPTDALLPPSYHASGAGSAAAAAIASKASASLPPATTALTAAPPFEAMLSLVQAADGRVSKLRIALRGGGHG
jgi:hypothetical protein